MIKSFADRRTALLFQGFAHRSLLADVRGRDGDAYDVELVDDHKG